MERMMVEEVIYAMSTALDNHKRSYDLYVEVEDWMFERWRDSLQAHVDRLKELTK